MTTYSRWKRVRRLVCREEQQWEERQYEVVAIRVELINIQKNDWMLLVILFGNELFIITLFLHLFIPTKQQVRNTGGFLFSP